ncbi:PREDICTED: uncharacterized mitochondrial protein AtMg00820 [Theobroma cacao]|uniref:Uncharacterized mitochondrial protein AtMg00820 n=1 Tax=Theobroma cacao TaxID=3641 RepID=A0AB32VWR2_THECC|nr:PREDICTED: uncharacterized mitochondrial protein AtMg00820 [Theobroma cacao]
MTTKLTTLKDNGTWSIVPLPSNSHPIDCKWVYKVKMRADGSVERYKTHLIAKDYSLSTLNKEDGGFIALLVYVNDIIIATSSSQLAIDVKTYLGSRFKLKDLKAIKYFLGLEVARSFKGIFICQRKYTLDLLQEHGLLGAKPATTPTTRKIGFCDGFFHHRKSKILHK